MQSDISVLIVEDEETWARKLTYDLGQFGFNIVACVDCVEDALPAIRANNFDIALLDINLGGKNSGIELGKLINESVKKPFIFITGSVNDDIMEETASARPAAGVAASWWNSAVVSAWAEPVSTGQLVASTARVPA